MFVHRRLRERRSRVQAPLVPTALGLRAFEPPTHFNSSRQTVSPCLVSLTRRRRKVPSGVALELRAKLAGEVVVLIAVVPVLLPLIHVLRVLLLRAPVCATASERGQKRG